MDMENISINKLFDADYPLFDVDPNLRMEENIYINQNKLVKSFLCLFYMIERLESKCLGHLLQLFKQLEMQIEDEIKKLK